MDVVLSLSGSSYRVQGLVGKKPFLEIRQEMITNHNLSYTKVCLYTLTSPTVVAVAVQTTGASRTVRPERIAADRLTSPRNHSGSVVDNAASWTC